MRNRRPLARGLLPLAFWLLVWQGVVWYLENVQGIRTEFILPAPLTVLTTLVSLAGDGEFWLTALATLGRIFAGLLGGVAVGTVLAVLTQSFAWADWIFSPAVRVIRATPVASFILLIILWAPTRRVPAIVAALMVLPVVWGNVSRGIAQTDPLLLEAGRAYRFSRWKTVRLIYIPSVLPTSPAPATPPWAWPGRRVWPPRCCACPSGPSAPRCIFPRSIWRPRTSSPGRWW